jgi:APA family basic amino acid/polyamine antiporter
LAQTSTLHPLLALVFSAPSVYVVWVVAGLIAIVIALCFAQCAMMLPKVGGPYAYATRAWGPFAGFIVGWSLWLAEWVSLPVFPLAFTRYLLFFVPNLDALTQSFVKVVFVAFLAVTNILGVRAAGRVNDVLTLLKLAPLVFFVIAGLTWISINPTVALTNFFPFTPFGFAGFGSAVVLIFWAYAGFEISTIPADDVDQPSKTIPKAVIIGILVVTVFYLTTNIILFAVRNYGQLATDTAPLAAASNGILSSNVALALFGGLLVGIGALISVAGSDESGMIGTARLGYALAADGLFPKIFAKIHTKFKTPYASVIIQSVTALAAALLAPLFGGLGLLISVSVFFLAIAYLATSAAVFPLRKKNPIPNVVYGKRNMVIPVLGIVFSIYLITQCSLSQIAIGVILLLVGIPIYIKYSPKKELAEAKQALISEQNIFRRIYRQEHVFLAHVIFHIGDYYRRLMRKPKKKHS